jgi:hypothetical protein
MRPISRLDLFAEFASVIVIRPSNRTGEFGGFTVPAEMADEVAAGLVDRGIQVNSKHLRQGPGGPEPTRSSSPKYEPGHHLIEANQLG